MRVVGILFGVAVLVAATCNGDTPESWDLVALGDSTPTGYGSPPGSAYTYQFAELVEQDLGVEIEVHDHSLNPTRTVAGWVEAVRTDDALAADLADAEVVTMWLGWHNVVNLIAPYGGDLTDELRASLADRTATMDDDFDELLSLIVEQAPEARVLIADTGIPPLFVERWADEPYWPEMKQAIYLTWRDDLVAAAEVHGATVIRSYQALNGPSGDEMPGPSLIQADQLHFTAEGQTFLAELHFSEAGLTVD